jgi:cell division cycle 14
MQISTKFVAFVGPKDKSPNKLFRAYDHEPHEFVPEFVRLGVSDIVRLNEATTYDKKGFTDCGFAHTDIYFDDCTVPSAAVMEKFLDVCDAAKGLLAVHCLAGLGRTGTLIAVWLIKNQKFTAREAIGYLRLMRPGSVIGHQQQFLELIERCAWSGNRILAPMDAWKLTALTHSSRILAKQVERAISRKYEHNSIPLFKAFVNNA